MSQNDEQRDLLLDAINAGEFERVEEILSHDPTLVNATTAQGLPGVRLALYYGQQAIADLLMDRGAVLDLFSAAAAGDERRVRELVGTDPDRINEFSNDGFQPLGLAAFFGREEVARFLISRGAQVNTPSENPMRVMPLHSAVAGGHLEVARSLLAAGADPNARQSDDFVPLHGAAQNGQVEMINLLLEYGADPSMTNKNGKSVLDFAKESGNNQAVAIFE